MGTQPQRAMPMRPSQLSRVSQQQRAQIPQTLFRVNPQQQPLPPSLQPQRYAVQSAQRPYPTQIANQQQTPQRRLQSQMVPLNQNAQVRVSQRYFVQQRPQQPQQPYLMQNVNPRATLQQPLQQPSAPQPRPQSVKRPYPQPQPQRPMPQRPSAPQPIKPMSMSKPLQGMDAQAQARARSKRMTALLHSRKPVRQQTEAQRPQSVSEISSVSAASSSPSMSNRFASADTSSKTPSDDTVISARSSLSDDSNSNSVSRGDVLNANASIGTRMSEHSNQAQPQRRSNQAQPMALPQRMSKAQRRKTRRKNHEWPTLSATQLRGQRRN